MNRPILLLLVIPFLGDAQAQRDLTALVDAAIGSTMTASSPGQPMLLDEATPMLELISFEASSTTNAGVSVQFATGSERPTERFLVQRSADRLLWETVATIPGTGGTDLYTTYQINDDAPLHGISYYRLVQGTSDDVEEISDEFSVRHEIFQDLTFQNASMQGHFYVLANGPLTDVVILNNRGQFMPLELNTEGDRVNVNATLLENGTYYVQAMVDGAPVMRPLMIVNGTVTGG